MVKGEDPVLHTNNERVTEAQTEDTETAGERRKVIRQ